MHGWSCCWKHRLTESLRVKAGTAQPAFILFLEFVFLLRWKAILKETLAELKPDTCVQVHKADTDNFLLLFSPP